MKSAIVIGAGIVGLATARALAAKGVQVQVFERHPRALGASIRNFGMVWPIGQPNGQLYDRAMRSRALWKELCTEGGIWHRETGSLHVAYHEDEMAVLEEFVATNRAERPSISLCTAGEAVEKSPALVGNGLLGALYSADEVIVDPREAIWKLPEVLEKKYGVVFHFGKAVSQINYPNIHIGKEIFSADEIFVCSGADFETLYPEVFATSSITKCKLQMMRTVPQPGGWNIGASLCAGLTLIHYKAFAGLKALPALNARYEEQYPDYLKWGIHVLVSQNGLHEVTLGDTHEYGFDHDPFDKKWLNDLVLDYLKTFVQLREPTIAESWNGIYPKMMNGATEFIAYPEEGVTIVNGMGGAGMTLSFGLAQEVVGI